MANTLFDKARQRFLEAQFNWTSDTIKCILVDSGAWTPVPATHEFLADVPVSARIAGPVTLTAKTTTGGAADAADCTFTAVSGVSIEMIVIYKDTGTEASSPLIAVIDTATGLPITPNGGDKHYVSWSLKGL
ncbi:hypothetical protein [Propionivibrio sp.]|uniref:hypothetical protein n=1 Tax=Propionivibrio sp. TaxID=2212460 RepID=UPI003BF0D866